MDKEMNKREKDNIRYEKLPKRALHCMYAADIVTGLIILAVIMYYSQKINWNGGMK